MQLAACEKGHKQLIRTTHLSEWVLVGPCPIGSCSSNQTFFSQYEVHYMSDEMVIQSVHYGRLEHILVCQLGDSERLWRALCGHTLLLALISPASTIGQDATMMLTHFSYFNAPVVSDVQSIKAVVGCVQSWRRWGIINCTPNLTDVVFAPRNIMDGSAADHSEGSGNKFGSDWSH